MPSLGLDLLAELLTLGFYLLVTAALTTVGLFAEYAGAQQLAAGDPVLSVWYAAIGAVFLYAGLYAVGYQRLYGRTLGSQ